jgi:uncharacterized protein related to proFAR isomerase
MKIELRVVVSLDNKSKILNQEPPEVLDSVVSDIKDLIYEHDEIQLTYIDAEIVR